LFFYEFCDGILKKYGAQRVSLRQSFLSTTRNVHIDVMNNNASLEGLGQVIVIIIIIIVVIEGSGVA